MAKRLMVIAAVITVSFVIAIFAGSGEDTVIDVRSPKLEMSPAAVPQMITYQGVLTDGGGNPLDTTVSMTFTIYDASSGGTALWTETHGSVTVVGGLFTVLLGSVTPIPSTVFDDPDRWLGLAVGGDPEMARERMTSVPYAFKCGSGDGGDDIYVNEVGPDTMSGNSSVPILTVINSGSGYGVYGESQGIGFAGLYGQSGSEQGIGVLGRGYATDAAGVVGYGTRHGVWGYSGAPPGLSHNRYHGVYGWTADNGGDATGIGVYGISTYPSGYGVCGETGGDASKAVYGKTNADSGYGGYFQSDQYIGLYAQGGGGNEAAYFDGHVKIWRNNSSSSAITLEIANDDGYGAFIFSSNSPAIVGRSDTDCGVTGWGNSCGVYGFHQDNYNKGNLGTIDYGVYGEHGDTDNFGYFGSSNYGAYGKHNGNNNFGYLGGYNKAVYGEASGTYDHGVHGYVSGNNGDGVVGECPGDYGIGVRGYSSGTNAYGVYGYAPSGNAYAGYFNGRANVTGTLTKGGGAFKIDHPLDPANKFLYHSFVESPDMMNVYNGNAILDAEGEAVVKLPDYFEALNRDFRYQLTCIGGFAPVYIEEEISNNQFKIAGGETGMKVSWQVTGIRQDAFANAHRIQVEEEKSGEERGKFAHPKEHGMPETDGIDYARLHDERE